MTNPDTNPKPPPQTLRKYERLSLKQAFDNLFLAGTPFFVKGIRFVVKVQNGDEKSVLCNGKVFAQVAFIVPKKYVRSAVNRNRIKRRLREQYRLKKHLWYEFLKTNNITVHIAVVYLSRKTYTSSYVSHIYELAFSEISAFISKNQTDSVIPGPASDVV